MSIGPKNNPKNRRALVEYQKRQLRLAQLTQDEPRQRKIQSNLDKWVDALPKELKYAIPKNLPKTVINKVKDTSLKYPYDKYTIICSQDIHTSKFTAYSIIYALLQKGIIIPSEIKITNIMDGYNNINGMFNSRQWKDYFFNNKAKVLLIEGSSKSLALLGSKGEEQFWRELAEFTNANDKLVIVTYLETEDEIQKGMYIPLLTSNNDLNSRLIKKSTFIKINKEEEKEIKDEYK